MFWLGGFTFPTGFLTAIMQVSARANGISVDGITWDFVVLKESRPEEISSPPKEGVYISGLYLEGAGYFLSLFFLSSSFFPSFPFLSFFSSIPFLSFFLSFYSVSFSFLLLSWFALIVNEGGTRIRDTWWSPRPCSWSIKCPSFISNLWK